MSDWIVKGPRATFRRMAGDDDEIVFQCMKDWPADKHGPMTRGRAMQRVTAACQENMYGKWPLVNKSDFHENFILEDEDGVAYGYTRCRIWGKRVWVDFFSHMRERRLEGRFDEAYLLYTYLIFKLWKAERVWHDDFTDVKALERMRERHGGEYFEVSRKRDRFVERDATKWMFTRKMYDELDEADLYQIDGVPLKIQVNRAAINLQNKVRKKIA